ncbi:MATE family efflux transporter [bacterium]|nr:MATE family efflux transporter [bacterium]
MKRLLALSGQITGDAPLAPLTARLAWPAIGMMYLVSAFNVIDTEFAGRLGATALAALSTGNYVFWAIVGLSNLVAVGTAAVVARRAGEHDIVSAERAAYQGVVLSVALSVIAGALVYMLAPWIYRAVMAASPEVTHEGLPYLRLTLVATPSIFLMITTSQIYQALGDTKKPMWFMVVAVAITFVLDYLLIPGNLGAPALGIRGAGVALLVSRTAFAIVALAILVSPRWPSFILRPHGRFRPDLGLYSRILGIGVPTAVEATLFPVVYMLLTRFTTLHGTAEVAALRVGHTTEGFVFFAGLGMGLVMRPLVGQNLGAGHPGRAARAPWVGTALLALPVTLYSAMLILVPEVVAAVFVDDGEVIAAAARYLRIIGWSQVFMMTELVFVGAFAGAGETLVPMLIILPLTLARFPLAVLTERLNLGIEALWWVLSGTSILKGIAIVIAFQTGVWKKRVV